MEAISYEKKKVLVVDDNALAANALVRLLTALKWDAVAAYSAHEAQDFLASNIPDILLLDIGMPGMDGYELASILRNKLKLTMPFVALTGYGLVEDRQRAIDAGFTAHLIKPVGMKELQETLTSLVLS